MLRSNRLYRAVRSTLEQLEQRRLLSGSDPGAEALDFGDAPDTYATLLASNGARHFGTPNLLLGSLVDIELDGQPSGNALRDDTTTSDDEDGIVFVDPVVQGAMTRVDITLGAGSGVVNAWLDFNLNGVFDGGPEHIIVDAPLPGGGVTTTVTFATPAAASIGSSYARFRLSQGPGLGPVGFGGFGEVEDYRVEIEGPSDQRMDFGDAPDAAGTPFAYPTIFAGVVGDPARHLLVPGGPILGPSIDPEPDGQPNLPATGDDLSILFGGIDDEDGVTVAGAPLQTVPLIPGVVTVVDVSNGGAVGGLLNAWFDWDASGSWDPGEEVAVDLAIPAGVTISVPVAVPFGAPVVGAFVYSRFRLSTVGGLSPMGAAQDGEVEDYRNRVEQPTDPFLDFGDAPQTAAGPLMYPTAFAPGVDPARHVLLPIAPVLGPTVDPEPDGQPDPAALGDDLNLIFPGIDDEDGVTLGGAPFEAIPLLAGTAVTLDIANSGPIDGFLNAWFDFDASGMWTPVEQVAIDVLVPAGSSIPLLVPIPAGFPAGAMLYSRFRLSTAMGTPPFGAAPDGEVEDYANIVESIPERLDFGDAPDTPGGPFAYPTIFGGVVGDPARHILLPGGPILGPSVDPEPDGQPNLPATGDDLSILFGGIDDENGITVGGAPFETIPLIPGAMIPIEVTNGSAVPAVLNAWFDWDADGMWSPLEQEAVDVPVPAGATIILPVLVPPGTPTAGAFVYSRFRLSTLVGLMPMGLAPDGEVEDYRNRVEPPPQPEADFGDAPSISAFGTSFPTLLAEGGPSHAFVAGMPILGALWDPEFDGAPTAAAIGDDTTALDDEDGVFDSAGLPLEASFLQASAVNTIVVVVGGGGPGFVNGWIDRNLDGDWADAGEHFIVDDFFGGAKSFTFALPPGPTGVTTLRFRVSAVAGLGFGGPAPDGEVEDYRVRVLPDVTPPLVLGGSLEFETRQAIKLAFSEPIAPGSVSAADLVALNLDDGTMPAATSVIVAADLLSATWVFNTPGTFVTNGDYSFTLAAGAVSDLAGNGLGAPFVLSGAGIFYLAGDANRDRAVDVTDLGTLASNWMMLGKPFSAGNFSYDVLGAVDVTDLGILASNFGVSLFTSAPSAKPAAPLFGQKPVRLIDRFGMRRAWRDEIA